MGVMLLFNYVLFPVVATLFVLPFFGMDKLNNVFAGHFTTETDKYVFLFVQGLASLGAFGLTSLLMSQLETRFVPKRLALTIKPAFRLVAVAIVSILAAQVLIQLLVELNQMIPVPNALKFLAEQGKQAEETEGALMKGHSLLLFLCNTLVLALIPALVEELRATTHNKGIMNGIDSVARFPEKVKDENCRTT